MKSQGNVLLWFLVFHRLPFKSHISGCALWMNWWGFSDKMSLLAQKQIIEHNIMKIMKSWHYVSILYFISFIFVYFSGSIFSNVRVCCWNSTVWIQIETLNLRDKTYYWIHGKIIERLMKKWFVWTQIMTWQRHSCFSAGADLITHQRILLHTLSY